ncbi:heavy metal translocating P-type ATPase [Flexithrix dorotheae]|uniref:heavy metal translocating P-type ATPase n=1 Tax=Flexithrix dorotheae TaxID=70993 RepID=UPI00037EBF1E|nr:heavy metal translocating P-type ATPase [Flexithrix dorotheae]
METEQILIENKAGLQNANVRVLGMTCASCAVSLESYLKPLDGVSDVSVNYPNQSLSLTYDKNQINLNQLKQKAGEIGYEILLEKNASNKIEEIEKENHQRLRIKLIVSAVFAIPVFVIAMFFMGTIPYENWIMMGFSIPVLFWSGREFFIVAWKKMLHFSANMDTLVALSTGVAFMFSVINTVLPQFLEKQGIAAHVYFESAVVIIMFILLGRYLEEGAKNKTSLAIKKLMGLRPKKVTVIRNGVDQTISYHEINRGELILLKPGDRIPVDGKVKKGYSFVDESMISGEPIAVGKNKGEKVLAGTINQKGSLVIISEKIGEETLLSQIIRQVEKAQASKPKIQKLVDQIAGIFVPVVIGLGIITFMIWFVFGPEPRVVHAMVSLITVLIIACPCALGLATPTALMVGIGRGAHHGTLIKDAQSLEMAYKIDTLILDKTGTITEGKPMVTDIIWSEEKSSELLQGILLSIESRSEHPIAEAITMYLRKNQVVEANTELFESFTGMGALIYFKGHKYLVGNTKLMDLHKVKIAANLDKIARQWEEEAKTVVYFSNDNKVEAIIAVADQVKSEAEMAIKQVKNLGVEVVMLTGDNKAVAEVIAQKVGIKAYKANLLPSDKGAYIEEIQKQGKIVAMAGDGINDAQGLAQADVGIAMGSGSDIAMESASLTLMSSNLNQIAVAIKLSKSTMQTIRQNLFWAFIYNLIAIPVAAGILYPISGFLLNPMIAGAAMALSSISVLANSLRLKNRTI